MRGSDGGKAVSTERYLASLPERVRVKIGLAPDLSPKTELSWEEVRLYGLEPAVEDAIRKGQRSVDALSRFGREFSTAVPEPAVAFLPRDVVASLASLLASRGLETFNESVVVRIGDHIFTISIEFECG